MQFILIPVFAATMASACGQNIEPKDTTDLGSFQSTCVMSGGQLHSMKTSRTTCAVLACEHSSGDSSACFYDDASDNCYVAKAEP